MVTPGSKIQKTWLEVANITLSPPIFCVQSYVYVCAHIG